MKQLYLILWVDNTPELSRPVDLIVGETWAVNDPEGTLDYVQYTRLGEAFGFATVCMHHETYVSLYLPQKTGTLSYERVHRNIWNRLKKRGTVLALRRSDKAKRFRKRQKGAD